LCKRLSGRKKKYPHFILTFTLYRDEEDFAFQTLRHGDEMHLTTFSSSDALSLFNNYFLFP